MQLQVFLVFLVLSPLITTVNAFREHGLRLLPKGDEWEYICLPVALDAS
jgi:hypothetical protein